MSRLLSFLDDRRGAAILSFLIPFGVYLQTLAPSVTFFDSGEFLTAIYSMGSAHSPGYPTFITFARPFLFIPFGSVAYRVNMATAVAGALACLAAYLLTRRIIRSLSPDETLHGRLRAEFASLAASLAFAFSPRLWLQSNHDKPYPLVAFVAAMVFMLLLSWRDGYREGNERPSLVYAGAFLSGLAFGAHQTMILMIPAYGAIIAMTDLRILLRIREMLIAVAAALCGFAIHLHLIVRATQKPILNWGDPSSLSQFLWHFLRKGYPVEKPSRDWSLLQAQLNAFNIPHEFTLAGLFFLVLALVWLWGRARYLVVSYLFALGAFLLVIVGYFNTPRDLIFLTEEFFTPLYLLSSSLIMVGVWFAVGELARTKPFVNSPSLSLSLSIILVMALPAVSFTLNYVENDQHENWIAHDYATNSLRSLPKGAVLYTWGDSGAFPLWYLQSVERMREDLDLLHTPHLVFDWYLDSFPHVFRSSRLRFVPLDQIPPETALLLHIDETFGKRPVYIDFSTRYSVPLTGLSIRQTGIVFEIAGKGDGTALEPRSSVWDRYTFRGMSGEMFFRDLDTGKAIMIYGSSSLEEGETLLRLGLRERALESFRRTLRITPELAGQVMQILTPFGIRGLP